MGDICHVSPSRSADSPARQSSELLDKHLPNVPDLPTPVRRKHWGFNHHRLHCSFLKLSRRHCNQALMGKQNNGVTSQDSQHKWTDLVGRRAEILETRRSIEESRKDKGERQSERRRWMRRGVKKARARKQEE